MAQPFPHISFSMGVVLEIAFLDLGNCLLATDLQDCLLVGEGVFNLYAAGLFGQGADKVLFPRKPPGRICTQRGIVVGWVVGRDIEASTKWRPLDASSDFRMNLAQ